MNTFLDQCQKRLEHHFEGLANKRSHGGLPLFALEHGLDRAETEEIAEHLRTRLKRGSCLAPHWLLWTVYAAERGYSYEGGEYWKSFEEATPGWESCDRYKIFEWFSRFQKTYNGFKPSGPWASHFSIIAGPITHAILPRYLQRQFARTIYELRFQLARLNSVEPTTVGRLLATNACYASTRFEQFLQQEELVGRIVIACLHQQETDKGEALLLPTTLERLVIDLERIRNAREWIKEASRLVSDHFKGLSKGSGPSSSGSKSKQLSPSEEDARPDIRPDLMLRYRGECAWDLQIDIPNFKGIAALNSDVLNFLRNTRCMLDGGSVKKPRGWLLTGRRQAVLREWPVPGQLLVDFEESNEFVSHLLASDCRMERGPYWVFRVGLDGMAREISGRIVRPGYEYIIVSTNKVEDLLEGMQPCKINCGSMGAAHIRIPQELSDNYSKWLEDRELEVAKTIRVWPVGLPGRHWDGEGKSEWLTTERPCIGIISDHRVDKYQISLNGRESLAIKVSAPGHPSFLQLSELPPGRHVLMIRAQRPEENGDRIPPHEGCLELRVREPEPWIPGTASHAGLIVSTNPYDAALSEFWENDYALSVFGPPSRHVTPYVRLRKSGEETFFERKVCGALELPITPSVWKKQFSDFLQSEKCEWDYLEASSGELILDGEELGQYVIRFEHEVHPLRWVLHQGSDGSVVRLVDETGQKDAEPQCYFFEMEHPRIVQRLNLDSALKGISVDSQGGLFVAKTTNYRSSVVVSTGLTSNSLQGLGVRPHHGHISGDPYDIIKLFKELNCWFTARVTGYLAGARRHQVTDTLMLGVVGIMAGWRWARIEDKLLDGGNLVNCIDRLHSLVEKRSGFASAVWIKAPQVSCDRHAFSSWYFELSKKFRICSDEVLCCFVLDLASHPHLLPSLYLEDLPALITRAQSNLTLVRGARLAVLSRMMTNDGLLTLLPEENG